MTTLYGIRNCDTMKKAWTWLDDHGVAYAFHDYKKQGVDRDRPLDRRRMLDHQRHGLCLVQVLAIGLRQGAESRARRI